MWLFYGYRLSILRYLMFSTFSWSSLSFGRHVLIFFFSYPNARVLKIYVLFQAHTGYNTTEEPRRKRQDDAKPNHILLFTIINPMYPITVVSYIYIVSFLTFILLITFSCNIVYEQFKFILYSMLYI